MRRLLLLVLALGLLIVGTFLVTFTFSRHRVSEQGYLTSLGDFLFMLDTYRRQSFELPPPPFSESRYEGVMARFRPHTHNEVEDRAVWRLARWGEAAVPFLVAELRPETPRPRQEGAIEALGEIGGGGAVRALGEWLCGLPRQPGPPVRRQVNVAVEALGETGDPAAAAILERCAEPRARADEMPVDIYWEALARSGGGVDRLLAEFEAADVDGVHYMLWEMAATRDPRVARAMAELLRHPVGRIRQRTRDSLDQFMGPAATDPALDVLESERDGYVISAIVRHVVSDSDSRQNPRVVPVLASLLGHPALGDDAVYGLARLGGEEAAAVLRDYARRDPNAVLSQMDFLREDGLAVVGDLLGSGDPSYRRAAIGAALEAYTPAARSLVLPLADDPDERVADDAREALLQLDKVELHSTWAESLPGDLSRQAWYALRPDMFGHDRGVERLWPVLTWVHWAGVVLSALVGLLLVFRVVSLFEPYRFQLFVTFLLVEGFVGDFFFMDQGAEPWQQYQLGTAVHLFLLIGFLCLPRDVAPGELRGRFEVLGGASVWLLVPLLLMVGTPVLALALRRSLSDWGNMRGWLALLVILTALVFEQWLVPWHAFARRARVERIVRGTLSTLVLALLGVALVAHARVLQEGGRDDDAWVALVLMLPMAFILLVHLHSLGFLRTQGTPPRLSPAPGRLLVVQDGESVRIRRKRRRSRLVQVVRVALVLGPAFIAGVIAGGSGKASGMLLAFAAAPLGAALGALVVLGLETPFVIQVRRGFVRSAATLLGASLGRAGWRRRVPRPEVRAGAREKWGALAQDEAVWLTDVVAGGSGEAEAGSPHGADLDLELRLGAEGDRESGLVPVRLRVVNRGSAPVSPAELDDHAGGVSWRARLGAETAPLYLTRQERETLIPPGGRAVLSPRIDVGRGFRDEATLQVTCPAGVSNPVTLPPWGRS